jgi:outer membrane protein assembly factor BamD
VVFQLIAAMCLARARGFAQLMPLRSLVSASLDFCGRVLPRLLAVWLVAGSIGACSSLFGDKDAVAPDEPAERLYNEGVFLLNERKQIKDAAKKFEEVERQHPYSEWARKALIMAAYSYYAAGEYDDAITAAQRYITLHPGNPDAAYAQYLIGSSYYDQIPDVTRDQSRTEKAVSALDEVERKYPNSEYASAARRKIEFARDQLAAKEMNVGRLNMQKKNFIGAINRFKVVVTEFQTTRHVEEALERLTECYMTLGIVSEAQTAAAVLGHNFPDSPWYKDAYNLVKGEGGSEPVEDKGSWISKAFKKLGVGAIFSGASGPG